MSLLKNQEVVESRLSQVQTAENIWLLLGMWVGQSSLFIFIERDTLSHPSPTKILVMPKMLWQIWSPLNVWTMLKTSGQYLLKGDSWTSLYLCSPNSTSRTWAPLFFTLRLFSLAIHPVLKNFGFGTKKLLCNTGFWTGRGRLEWKRFSIQHGWGQFSPWCWALWQYFWIAFSTRGKATTVSAVNTYTSTHPVLLR